VKDFFSKYGDIIEAQIIRDNQRNHKGCAFVKFRSLTEAQNAIEQLKNNKI
jgi:RNA recognition motif-containing protein